MGPLLSVGFRVLFEAERRVLGVHGDAVDYSNRKRESREGKHFRNYGNVFDVVDYATDSIQNTQPSPQGLFLSAFHREMGSRRSLSLSGILQKSGAMQWTLFPCPRRLGNTFPFIIRLKFFSHCWLLHNV